MDFIRFQGVWTSEIAFWNEPRTRFESFLKKSAETTLTVLRSDYSIAVRQSSRIVSAFYFSKFVPRNILKFESAKKPGNSNANHQLRLFGLYHYCIFDADFSSLIHPKSNDRKILKAILGQYNSICNLSVLGSIFKLVSVSNRFSKRMIFLRLPPIFQENVIQILWNDQKPAPSKKNRWTSSAGFQSEISPIWFIDVRSSTQTFLKSISESKNWWL